MASKDYLYLVLYKLELNLIWLNLSLFDRHGSHNCIFLWAKIVFELMRATYGNSGRTQTETMRYVHYCPNCIQTL
jgi:formate dehydrogenase maturation protein FdhE